MRNFITLNEGFICKNCGLKNPPLKGSCRNHCIRCLYSMHMDEKIPGDRKSSCRSLMEPFKIDQSGKKGWIIYHKCRKCGKVIPNKAAKDDQFETIIAISQNESTGSKKT